MSFIPWKSIIELENINDMVETLNTRLLPLFDKHAPRHRFCLRSALQPYKMMSLRNTALRRASMTVLNIYHDYYKSLRSLVNSS